MNAGMICQLKLVLAMCPIRIDPSTPEVLQDMWLMQIASYKRCNTANSTLCCSMDSVSARMLLERQPQAVDAAQAPPSLAIAEQQGKLTFHSGTSTMHLVRGLGTLLTLLAQKTSFSHVACCQKLPNQAASLYAHSTQLSMSAVPAPAVSLNSRVFELVLGLQI